MFMSICLISAFLPSVFPNICFRNNCMLSFKVFLSLSCEILVDYCWYPDLYGYYFFYCHLPHAISKFTTSSNLLPHPFKIYLAHLDPQLFSLKPISYLFYVLSSPNWILALQFMDEDSLNTNYVPSSLFGMLYVTNPLAFTALKKPTFLSQIGWVIQITHERVSFLGQREAALLCAPNTGLSALLVWILFYRRWKFNTNFWSTEE